MAPTSSDDDGIEQRAATHQIVDGRLALLAPLDVDVGVIGDQPRRPADLRHHRVAGIDAQPTLNAAEIGTAADIDAGRADMHALQAIDAIAGRLAVFMQRRSLLQRRARLTAVVTIGNVERVFVGQGRLDPRPRAHIDADLFAHPAGQRVSRKCQHADKGIGGERRLERRQIFNQSRRVGEIQHPSAAGPPRDHQPPKML